MSKKEKKAPERKLAPVDVTAGMPGQGARHKLLERLNAENPGFVHMYQRPEVLSGGVQFEYELEAKNQEVVKRPDGKIEHHRGDPVVRMRLEYFDAMRQQESEFSRKQVETVVKPQRSTVLRKQKQQIE